MMKNLVGLSFMLLSAVMLSVGTASAQQAGGSPVPHQQVVSANPIGLLLEFFNAEYERVLTPYSTVGFGGSYFSLDDGDDEFSDGEDENYLNADVFYRFYPQGSPLDGFAFGGKAGITRVDDETYFGAGFDANYSWLLGQRDNFYVGVGIGLKRLFGAEENLLSYVPTVRLVNIGYAF